MVDKAKWPVMLLILFLIIALTVMGLAFIALQKEKENSVSLSKSVEELKAMRRLAESQVDKLRQQVGELQENFDESQKRVITITEELEFQKTTKEETVLEISQLKEELATVLESKTEIETKLKASELTLKNLQNELAVIKIDRDGLLKKVKDLEAKSQSVQLDKIVVPSSAEDEQTPQEQPQIAPTVEGRVLVVNREHDFVVVNLGRKDNLDIGDTLDVFRRKKKIGQVKIEEIRDTMSVATPLSKGLTRKIKEDDKVTYQ